MNSRIDFFPPRDFTLGWKIFMNIVNLTPTFMVLGSFGGGLVLSAIWGGLVPAVLGTLGSLFIYAFYMFLFPFFNGNSLLPGRLPMPGGGFVVQITFAPRLRSGMEMVLDDADDFAALTVEGDYVILRGASTYVAVHRADLASVHTEDSGFYSMFLLGASPVFTLKVPVSGIFSFKLAIREGNTLPASRARGRAMIDMLNRHGLLPPKPAWSR